jgi:diguanylate cyclase (GGDEF)-like protein
MSRIGFLGLGRHRLPVGKTITALLVVNLVVLDGFPVLLHASVEKPAYIVIVNLSILLPALACFTHAFFRPGRRGPAIWLGLAILAQGAGNVIYATWTQYQTHPPVPSPSDIAYLGFYLSVTVAVVWLASREHGSFPRAVWLDGAIGAAGAATALAAGLTLLHPGPRGDSAAVIVGGAYTAGDLLLVAMIAGLLAIRGVRGGLTWVWLAAGMAIFCAADVAYAIRVDAGNYAISPLLELGWMTGVTCIARSLWSPQRPPEIDSARPRTVLAIPTLATATALGALAIFSFGSNPAVMSLATFTLLLAAARTVVSFRQVQRLSDAHRQAITDDLTGLGNRRSLFEHGRQKLDSADAAERLALILIDLDNFKEINDSFGHPAGDELLREVARRLADREIDNDLLVRLGGDEFAVLITLAPTDESHRIAVGILDRIGEPFTVAGARLLVNASAGIAERNGEAVDIVDLLRRADIAMYAAKDAHSRAERYDPQLDQANRIRLETIQDLNTALDHHEFVLHYQPKIDVASGVTFGAEALVRWQHPTRGLLYPDAFLPIVEQVGLMHAVTREVLAAAVRQVSAWKRAGLDISVAVNLSASDLLDDSLADRIETLLDEHSVPADALELEITESVIMFDPDRARTVLEALRLLGCRIAIDDYGTGYCALAYLRDLPVDELKLDRSFVAGVSTDPRSAAIVRSTIELAHALGLQVVAEGIEDQRALNAVASFDCDYAQGYHFGRPVPAAAFAAAVRLGAVENRARAVRAS